VPAIFWTFFLLSNISQRKLNAIKEVNKNHEGRCPPVTKASPGIGCRAFHSQGCPILLSRSL
jgi:hypothetical protein